jgi:pimeloyl-ACP methyl ester carboxylesterase
MRWSQLRRTGRVVLLISALFVLAACGSGTPSSPTSASTPHPTPTPTIPVVPSRLVHFSTSDHVQLAGLLFGRGKTGVVCSHELNTTKAIWSQSRIVPLLALRGYMVLAYDFRGNGDSAGQADTTLLGVDLRAAIAFVRQQGATKIVLLGSSMGGTATLKVAASEQIAAVVTLSAPQNFGPGTSDAEVKAIKAAKFFVNSKEDDYANDTMHMYAIASQPKEIKLYPGFLHGTAIFDSEDGNDLTQRILNFVVHNAPAD